VILGERRCETRRVVGFEKLVRCVGVDDAVGRGTVVLLEGMSATESLGGEGLLVGVSFVRS